MAGFHTSDHWIGATDQWEEGRWQTPARVDIPISFWQPKAREPNGGTIENCAAMFAFGGKKSGTWTDYRCALKYKFSCQKSGTG